MNDLSARRQQGFTLVEVVITVVLMGILTAFGAQLLYNNVTTTKLVNSGQAKADRARYAMERLSRELREIKVTSGAAGISPLTAGTATVTFTRTINGVDTTVVISSSGGVLTLAYGSPATLSSTLIDGVTSFSLNFYDTSGAATTSTTDVKTIEINLTATDSTSGQTVAQRSRIALRNA